MRSLLSFACDRMFVAFTFLIGCAALGLCAVQAPGRPSNHSSSASATRPVRSSGSRPRPRCPRRWESASITWILRRPGLDGGPRHDRQTEYFDVGKLWCDRMLEYQKGMIPGAPTTCSMGAGRARTRATGTRPTAPRSRWGAGRIGPHCRFCQKQRYRDSAMAFFKLVAQRFVRPSGGVTTATGPSRMTSGGAPPASSAPSPFTSMRRPARSPACESAWVPSTGLTVRTCWA